MNKKSIIAIVTVLAVLVIDQISKIMVKTSMKLEDSFAVLGNWFYIHFTENNGMAMGLEWGGVIGKYALSGFRLIAISFITYYIISLIKKNAHGGFIFCMALILAGAAGNMIDGLFYGLFFSESTIFEVATAFPEQGYASLLQGKVVDMLYFPMFYMPAWVPVLGGHNFFPYIFNVADAAISVGVVSLVIFQKRFSINF